MNASDDLTAADIRVFENPPAEPLDLLRSWLSTARSLGVTEPTAVSLATVSADGTPSARFVTLRDVTDDGVVFCTSTDSPKGREMRDVPTVALAAHWAQAGRQFRIKGVVSLLNAAESDRLFAAVPRAAQAAVIVARQSQPLESQATLTRLAAEVARGSEDLQRPDDWRAWLVTPGEVQFWAASPDHLHHRLAYARTATGWSVRRLQP